jgi:phage tail tape-measure protein
MGLIGGELTAVGSSVGAAVGEAVGSSVGEAVGSSVGAAVGPGVGSSVGDAVGYCTKSHPVSQQSTVTAIYDVVLR